MSFLPIDGPPGLRDRLVRENPGMYQTYISSPWQVWPAVPVQHVLEPAPPWGGLVESSSGAMLYTRHSPVVAMQPGLLGLGALMGALDQRSDEQKNEATTLTRGILVQAQALNAATPDWQVAQVRAQIDGARTFLMSGARWDDTSWKPVVMGGWDSWQDNMSRVNQAQNLVKLQQGTISHTAVNADGTAKQDSVAWAAAGGAVEGAKEGAQNLVSALPAIGMGTGGLVALAAAAWLLSKR